MTAATEDPGLPGLRERYQHWTFWEAHGRVFASREEIVIDAASPTLLSALVWDAQMDRASRIAAERRR